jgi:hypothetical protein
MDVEEIIDRPYALPSRSSRGSATGRNANCEKPASGSWQSK